MISKIKKPVSILLALMMIAGVFAAVPTAASAAEETSTVKWGSFTTSGGMSSGGVTLTTTQGNTRVGKNFYAGRGSATFTAPEGSAFTKIELKDCSYVDSLNFPGATVAQTGSYYDEWDEEWYNTYTVTWTGESSEVTFSGAIYGIQSIVFTLKSTAPPTYTVTWKNGDTVIETDTDVAKDATPEYNGATPTKAADDSKHYTFSGWSNGTTTYGLNDTLPAVSGDVTYTAQFTEDNHAYTANPTFNWTQDANGDWTCDKLTLSCSCGETQDTDVTGFFGASVVTCTADANGDFTYSVSKKVDGVTYSDTKTLEANGVVKSATQLKAAAKQGGSWELGSDIDQAVGISCADGFVLDGKNHTVTRHSNVATNPVFVAANKNAGFTLKNLTIDGIANQTEVRPAVASAQTNGNSGNVINLDNVKIVNWDFDQNNNGAVLAWGNATVNMKNCDVDTDSDYDVWGGAASTVNIDGGKAGTVYLNGGTSSATVDNGASVTVETSKPESVTIAPGYALNDNGDGTYTVVIDNSNPLNPIEKAAASINDGNPFGISSDYLKGILLGVQRKDKAEVNAPKTSENGDQETGNDLRFIAVLDSAILKDTQHTTDYGFVIAKLNSNKNYGNTDITKLKANWGNGEKTISAKETSNNLCGDYGLYDSETDYKYITCAVNGMNDTDQVVVRFYVVIDGVTYYSKYAGHDYKFTGCITKADLSPVAE